MMTQDKPQDKQDQMDKVSIDEAAAILKEEMERNGWRGGANTLSSWALRGGIRSVTTTRGGRRRRIVSLEEVREYIRRHGLEGEPEWVEE